MWPDSQPMIRDAFAVTYEDEPRHIAKLDRPAERQQARYLPSPSRRGFAAQLIISDNEKVFSVFGSKDATYIHWDCDLSIADGLSTARGEPCDPDAGNQRSGPLL